MNKENMKKEILEQQSEVISENFVGIDYDAVFPKTTTKSLVIQNENFIGIDYDVVFPKTTTKSLMIESENFIGIDYDVVFPKTTTKSLMIESEKLCYFGDFGTYVKGEW